MIVEAIFSLFFSMINTLINSLPVVVLFGGIFPSPGPIIEVIANVDCILPVGTAFACLTVWLAVANFDLLMSVFNFIIRKVPGVN